MNCELSATTLHGYFDRELDAVRAAEFEEHLRACAQCQSTFESLGAMRNALQNSELYVPASRRLSREIRKQISAGSGGFASSLRRNWALAPAFSLVIVAVVLPLTLWMFASRWQSARLQSELIDAHVRSLQPGHLTDVESTDQHTVKPWFDGKLDYIPPVSDFSQQGFPLLGGRLDVINGRDVAVLVYGRRKHVINLFAWPHTKSDSTAIIEASHNGYNLLAWRSGDMQLCLISDAAVGDLRELKDLVHP